MNNHVNKSIKTNYWIVCDYIYISISSWIYYYLCFTGTCTPGRGQVGWRTYPLIYNVSVMNLKCIFPKFTVFYLVSILVHVCWLRWEAIWMLIEINCLSINHCREIWLVYSYDWLCLFISLNWKTLWKSHFCRSHFYLSFS